MNAKQCLEYRLGEEELPAQWYNFLLDLPKPLPPVEDVHVPPSAEIMAKIRPVELLRQNAPSEPWVAIPDPVRERLLQIGRPTPLRRALALEAALQTRARIYIKREDTLVTGSFKVGTAVAQAYYAKEEGRDSLVSETGAGQWGMSLALVSQMFGLKCKIFMTRCSLEQKRYRDHYMRLLGTEVSPSPSRSTEIGRRLLEQHPGHPGTMGTAISEAIETALATPGAAYLSGSNVNHVHLHQTLLGQEVRAQLALAGEHGPDQLIACVSGGSNLCGFMLPFLPDKKAGRAVSFLGAESTAAPRLTQGTYEYCSSDPAGYTPRVLAYSMGPDFIPLPVHAGGLRQHNSSPLVSLLRKEGLLDATAIEEREAFEAGRLLLRTEGFLVAPESAHAVAAAIQAALRARADGSDPCIVVLGSGSGMLDLEGYRQVLL
ncbi:TrpB-like pyridoxal phosphate-dependent enzyme [Massilia sp. BJB1822]|uniref:TrpB-like pyridoxal phosphate-dependent enzyme n=1 Tax=Massilia sp. BJB1822 TaxID=2744470 RepID=UPI0015936633|nr:TrpB-like pyridoxal phosphate-dependent enzyme [Massilia sp. BJB1822]NVD98808.1 TrpB-like pyridoxal phosphate-dependent enzyme [Massilia sp. BJB1822]